MHDRCLPTFQAAHFGKERTQPRIGSAPAGTALMQCLFPACRAALCPALPASEATAQCKSAASLDDFSLGQLFTASKESITNTKQRLTSNDTPLHFGEQQLITAVLALFFPFSCIIRSLWISRSTLDPQPEGDATELKFSEGRIEYKPQNSLFPLMNWLVSQENIWLVYFQWQDMKEKHLSASRTPNRTALKRSSSELPSLNSFKLCRNNFLVDTRQNWIVLIFLRCQDVGRSPLALSSSHNAVIWCCSFQQGLLHQVTAAASAQLQPSCYWVCKTLPSSKWHHKLLREVPLNWRESFTYLQSASTVLERIERKENK